MINVFYKSVFYVRSCEENLPLDKDFIKHIKSKYTNIHYIHRVPSTEIEYYNDIYNKYELKLKEPATYNNLCQIICDVEEQLQKLKDDEYLGVKSSFYFKNEKYI